MFLGFYAHVNDSIQLAHESTIDNSSSYPWSRSYLSDVLDNLSGYACVFTTPFYHEYYSHVWVIDINP